MQETAEETELHLEKARERVQAWRMQETTEEKELHHEKAKARRMEDTPLEKEVHLEKGHTILETENRQKIVKQTDSLKMSNNGLSLALSINQLNSQVRKTVRSLNHRYKPS